MAKILALFVIILSGCALNAKKADFSQVDGEISVMAYNVENLFDNEKDKDREDYTYLPLETKKKPSHIAYCNTLNNPRYKQSCLELDWSNKVIDMKLFRVADAIKQINSGRGPDVLVLVEVENKKILDKLNKEHLQKSYYKTAILIEGPDKRGIDIAVLSRLPEVGKAQLHKIPFKGNNKEDQKWMSRSRGILQVKLSLPNKDVLNVYGVHFPSPRNPSYWRKQAMAHLNTLQSQLPKNELAIAAGDFNISARDEKENRLYSNDMAKSWLISHQIGCTGCRGTNYYHKLTSWSFLDAIGFSKNFDQENTSSWTIVRSSIAIPTNSKYQVNNYLSPARFSENSPVGVSDHWPIYAKIRLKKTTETKK